MINLKFHFNLLHVFRKLNIHRNIKKMRKIFSLLAVHNMPMNFVHIHTEARPPLMAYLIFARVLHDTYERLYRPKVRSIYLNSHNTLDNTSSRKKIIWTGPANVTSCTQQSPVQKRPTDNNPGGKY